MEMRIQRMEPTVSYQLSHLTVVYSFLMETLFPGCFAFSRNTVTVTDVGVRCLAALPNLISLAISYIEKLSDVALEAIASRGKLQKLVCIGCRSFTDVGCIRYINTLFIVNIFLFVPLENHYKSRLTDMIQPKITSRPAPDSTLCYGCTYASFVMCVI
jgi:hypothetical protein